jgi:hypothetical protein
LQDFSYRKPFTVSNSTGSPLSNYQIALDVYRTTGTDSGTSVYLGTGVKSDFSDLRFTNSTGTTVLDYYISAKTSSHAMVWVEFDSLPASTASTFYVYYGNAGASAVSSFSNTFIALTNGNFETGNFNGWPDFNSYEGWGVKGTYTASVSSTNPPEGNYWGYLRASGGETQWSGKSQDVSGLNIKASDGIRLMYYANFIEGPDAMGGDCYSFAQISMDYSDGSHTVSAAYSRGSSYRSPLTDYVNNIFTGLDPKTKLSADVQNPSNNYAMTKISIIAFSKYTTADVYFDTIGIAKYLSTGAPVVAGWSAQQAPIVNITYTAGTGGTITGTTSQQIAFGGNGSTVTAVPNAGYSFSGWSDGTQTTTHTMTNATQDLSITANFTINTFTLHYSAGDGGSISGLSTQTINYGSDSSAVTATANVGYMFTGWSDGSTSNPRTDIGVTANVSVSAIFQAIGSAILAPVPSVGAGILDVFIPMYGQKSIGEMTKAGTNVLAYIGSTGDFIAEVSSTKQSSEYSFNVSDLDMQGKTVGLKIGSLSGIVRMGIKDATDIDLDGDHINDVHFVFNGLLNNRVDLTISQLDFVVPQPVNNTNDAVPKNDTTTDNVDNIKPTSPYVFNRNLRLGMTGDDVKALQQYLNNNGYPISQSGIGSRGNEINYFGVRTKLALIKFQKAHNILPATGYFGPITRKVINGG